MAADLQDKGQQGSTSGAGTRHSPACMAGGQKGQGRPRQHAAHLWLWQARAWALHRTGLPDGRDTSMSTKQSREPMPKTCSFPLSRF